MLRGNGLVKTFSKWLKMSPPVHDQWLVCAPTIYNDCRTFLTCFAQSSYHLVERINIKFVNSLFYLLCQLISESSLVWHSSSVPHSWRRNTFAFVHGSFTILNWVVLPWSCLFPPHFLKSPRSFTLFILLFSTFRSFRILSIN